MSEPLVAIVGAPNVGKSTLFNRLIGRRHAIVTDEPGVTRDRLYGVVRDAPRSFRLVDTGGLTPRTAAPFADEIEQQASVALDEASVVLFVVDVRNGPTALDADLAPMLRKRDLPILLVANKVDSPKIELLAPSLHELGLGEPLAVSAEHGLGIDELLDRIASILGEQPTDEQETVEREDALAIGIFGRPNVGKSSLLNRLVGEDRVLVSELPGTTRDAIDTVLDFGERRYRLIDTAGLRRRGKPRLAAERFSVVRARQNIERCDVAVLLLDAAEGFVSQDAHIAGYVMDAYRPMVVAVNKWDLVSSREAEAKRWTELVRHRLRFAKKVPLLFISAKTGQRATRILDQADELHAAAGIEISTSRLNRWLGDVVGPEANTPGEGRSASFFYVTQTGVHPPSFVIFCGDPERVHFSTLRYLENTLRERFGFGAAPIRIRLRKRR